MESGGQQRGGPQGARRILYLVDDRVTSLDYSPDHLMRPVRIRLAHALSASLGLLQSYPSFDESTTSAYGGGGGGIRAEPGGEEGGKRLRGITVDIFRPPPAQPHELYAFHPPQYVAFLQHAADRFLTRDGGGSRSRFEEPGEEVAVERSEVQHRLPSCALAGGPPPCDAAHVGHPPGEAAGCGRSSSCECDLSMLRDYGLYLVGGHAAKDEDDCPLFDTLWPVVASYVGGSLAAARALRDGRYDVAIHWGGGMHHAAPQRASGFCYANDIVLAIKELLLCDDASHPVVHPSSSSFAPYGRGGGGRRTGSGRGPALLDHSVVVRRVLYVDLDVHHGDGVENAFRNDPRVITLSVHQFGDGFFPGTGNVGEVGSGLGRGTCVNVPLPAGTGGEAYVSLFTATIENVMSTFDPTVVVLQCGADTIVGDVLGRLDVSTRDYARCVEAVLSYELPTLILGGGGYNVVNTAKCWAIVTACAVRRSHVLPPDVPVSCRYFHALKADGTGTGHSSSLHVDVVKSPALALSDGKKPEVSQNSGGAVCAAVYRAVCAQLHVMRRRYVPLLRTMAMLMVDPTEPVGVLRRKRQRLLAQPNEVEVRLDNVS